MGIDVGTSSSKGVIVDLEGRILAGHVTEHSISAPHPGWAEHDPDAVWWHDVTEISKALMAKSGVRPSQVAGLGVSALAACMLPVDRHGRPLRPAILYGIDTRSAEEVDLLDRLIGHDRVFRTCGYNLSCQAVGPKILWFKRHEQALFRQTHKILGASSYLVYKLTGTYAIDTYQASSVAPFFNIGTMRWDDTLCEGILPLALFPDIRWSADVAGTITPKAAHETGLEPGIPVITGTCDAAAEAVSVGAVNPGDTVIIYGSCLMLIQALSQLKLTPGLWSSPHCIKERYVVKGSLGTGAILTKWFRDNLGYEDVANAMRADLDPYEVLAEGASHIPAGSEGLLVVPHFSGMQTPLSDPWARGVIAGLSLTHTRQHLYRALLEGVGFAVREITDAMSNAGVKPNRLIAVGGGSRNRVWLQIVSDILNSPQTVPSQTVGACYGDAFLAGYGVGVLPSLDILQRHWVKEDHEVVPIEENHRTYAELYPVYREACSGLRQQVHHLARLAGSGDAG